MTSSNGNNFRVTGPLCGKNHRSPVNSTHKGQWRGASMFSLICAWINGWVNHREAGDLRSHGDLYDITVMKNVVCKMSVVIFRPQYFKCKWSTRLWLTSDSWVSPFFTRLETSWQHYKISRCIQEIAWRRHQMGTFSALLALWGESTGQRWIPHTKASDAEFWSFLWSSPEQNVGLQNVGRYI